MNRYDLEKKVIIVTGGAGQLGGAVVTRLAHEGARLEVPCLNRQEMERFQSAHPELASQVRLDLLNATDPEQAMAYCAEVAREAGAIHGLVNLAGGYAYGPPVADLTDDEALRLFHMNAVTCLNMCRAALPHLRIAGGGHIVNIGARGGVSGSAGHAAYAMAKSAVQRLTEALSEEVKGQGIHVNCILPSIIDTPANRAAMPAADPATWVSPEALADMVAFLCSSGARALHGASIPVYGLA